MGRKLIVLEVLRVSKVCSVMKVLEGCKIGGVRVFVGLKGFECFECFD